MRRICQQMTTIQVSGESGATVKSLDCFSYSRPADRNGECRIDLTDLTFIHPSAVVGLLCLIERMSGDHGSATLILPRNRDVVDYFAKVHLLPALESLGKVVGEQETLDSLMPKLTTIVPVQSFSTEKEVEAIAQGIENTMREQGFVNLLSPCYTIVAELASNAVQHSNAQRAWVLAQGYQYTSERMIEIGVGDAGIGIKGSLRKNPEHRDKIVDDATALRKVIGGGVSRFKDPLRGNGLYQISREIESPDRRFTVRSGTGALVVFGSGRHRVYSRAPIAGVLAEARIPC